MRNLLLITFLLLSVISVFAQPGPGPLTAPPTPIDGGLSILLATGAAIGYKKSKKTTQKNQK